MRTGADYRKSLRDGRRVWIMGEGLIDDVTTHPATRATVDEYVAWYDRHQDPAWRDTLLTPPDPQGNRKPWAFVAPRSATDLRARGRSYSGTTFLSAGNITHTPAYGNLIALGIQDAVHQRNVSPDCAFCTCPRVSNTWRRQNMRLRGMSSRSTSSSASLIGVITSR